MLTWADALGALRSSAAHRSEPTHTYRMVPPDQTSELHPSVRMPLVQMVAGLMGLLDGRTVCPGSGVPEGLEVLAEGFREVRPPQGEIDDGLEKPQFVARVVADARHFAPVERPFGEEPFQSVGELDLAGAIVRRLLEGGAA